MHFAVLRFTLCCKGKARFGPCAVASHEARGQSADLRPVLETMARPTADQDDIGQGGVAIDQEIAVGAVLILADFGAEDWRALEQWEAPDGPAAFKNVC